jgi:hypothetical protein
MTENEVLEVLPTARLSEAEAPTFRARAAQDRGVPRVA